MTEDESLMIAPQFGIRESEHQLNPPGDLLPMIDADLPPDISNVSFPDDAHLLSIWGLADN